MAKVYVNVGVIANTAGEWMPQKIYWEDGRQFEVERVAEVKESVSMEKGCTDKRYTCIIKGKPKHLYYENPKWCVEVK